MSRPTRDDEFRAFVDARGRSLIRRAYLLTRDHHLAEDLVQSVLTKVALRWWRLGSPDYADAYARKALYREYVSWRRVGRNREIPVDDTPERDAPGPSFVDSSLHKLALDDALAQLPPRQRAAILLRFYDDRSVEETAEILRCSTGTVKSQTHAALAKLRELCADVVELGGTR
jgi:RNA polymerase sigma-70 factor (sigma-E family)